MWIPALFQTGFMTAQPTLFEISERSAFEKYHAENPEIYAQFKRFTFEKINRGFTHCGAKAVIERIRWETSASGGDGFKINNNFPAYYARLFMKDFPKYEGFFRLRKSKADQEIGI